MGFRLTRNRLTWLAYLMMAFYGYFLNILGPISPFLKDELALSYTISSLHFTAFAVGILCIGVGGHVVIGRLGRRRALWIGALGMSVSVLLLLGGRNPVVTIGACFLMGLVGSLILVVVPAALSDQHGELRSVALSEANVIASAVAAAASLMVGWSVYVTGNWRPALGIVAIAPFLMFWGFGRVSLPATAATRLEPNRRGESLPVLYWTYWVALALAVAVEFCMIFWSADYLQHALGMAQANAAQAVSLFLIGMIAGRVAGSRIVPRIPINKFVTLSILVAGIGFMIYWQAGSLLSGLGSLFVTGLGVGSLYPLILSLAIGAAGDKTVRASGRATLASGTAILILPLVLGRLADAIGIRLALGVVMVALAGVLFIILITARLTPLGQPVIES